MKKGLIKKEDLSGIIRRISEEATLYGPVKEDDFVLFRRIGRDETPLLRYANTRNAPKQFLFPPREELMRYRRNAGEMVFAAPGKEAEEAVLFGVRPCDARSFALLDMLFDQDNYKDTAYIERRNKTAVIALACVHPPSAACFCTAVGGSPASQEGADALLTDLGASYLIEFVTAKGERLFSRHCELEEADDAALAMKREIEKQAAGEIKSAPPVAEIKPLLDRIFDHPFWEGLHEKCLKCGTCTFFCPTCHCFDINDETRGNEGVRIRNWDSCMFPLFTMTASGHNPRPSQKERWRQRVMHKFKYYVDNFGAAACVGCGRCVMLCPVNMDIRKIISDIAGL